jgi:hypothetical protein
MNTVTQCSSCGAGGVMYERELFVWMTRLVDGTWSEIGAYVTPAVQMTLSSRSREVAEQFRDVALRHGRELGQHVELVHFVEGHVAA